MIGLTIDLNRAEIVSKKILFGTELVYSICGNSSLFRLWIKWLFWNFQNLRLQVLHLKQLEDLINRSKSNGLEVFANNKYDG